MLSKYERVSILSQRVKQLNAGASSSITPKPGETTYDIAVREIETKAMPIRVVADPKMYPQE